MGQPGRNSVLATVPVFLQSWDVKPAANNSRWA